MTPQVVMYMYAMCDVGTLVRTYVPSTVTDAFMVSVPKSLLRQSVYLPESVG